MSGEGKIEEFYTAFQNKNADGMCNLYSKEVVFNDEAFKNLNHEKVCGMWRMLISGGKDDLTVIYRDVEFNAETNTATCVWEADYLFGPKKNKVHNVVTSNMKFNDEGLIIQHDDSFSFYKWSSQSLGLVGKLLGWSGFLRNQVQTKAGGQLDRFIAKQKAKEEAAEE